MDEIRLDLAMNRIEAAFSRVAKATSELAAREALPASPDEMLRERVGSALADLDALIADLEP